MAGCIEWAHDGRWRHGRLVDAVHILSCGGEDGFMPLASTDGAQP